MQKEIAPTWVRSWKAKRAKKECREAVCVQVTIEKLAQGIGLAEDTAREVAQLVILPEKEEQLYAAFVAGQEEFEQLVKQEPHPELLVLALYMKWALATYECYQEAGIPQKVFWDTFADLRIWSDQYRERTGKAGITTWGWNAKHLRREIYRLGRLQYEPRRLVEAIEAPDVRIAVGTPVLEIHIPAGEPLRKEELALSVQNAWVFFEQHFGQRYEWMHCHTWLLAKELRELLPPQAGIMQFGGLFTVYDEDYEEKQAEERVFGEVKQNPQDYSEESSLQKKMKAYLLQGGQIGMGKGVICRGRWDI